MSKEQIFEKLNKIFRKVFDDPEISVTAETTAADVEDWDSLMHITLIGAIEDEFDVTFAIKDIIGMKNVGSMVDLILDKIK